MAQGLRTLTESDLVVISTRVDGVEKGLAIHQQQSIDVISKMAVFESALKRFDEDVRRIGERHEKSISDLKTTTENNYNSIFDKLESISDALGLDGTPANKKRLRSLIEKLDRTDKNSTETWTDLRKNLTWWTARCLIVFVVGAIVLRLGFKIELPGVI